MYDKYMNIIIKFNSTKEAEEKTGIKASHITKHISSKTKLCMGFIFKYELILKESEE